MDNPPLNLDFMCWTIVGQYVEPPALLYTWIQRAATKSYQKPPDIMCVMFLLSSEPPGVDRSSSFRMLAFCAAVMLHYFRICNWLTDSHVNNEQTILEVSSENNMNIHPHCYMYIHIFCDRFFSVSWSCPFNAHSEIDKGTPNLIFDAL